MTTEESALIAHLVEDATDPIKLLILTKSTGGLATYNHNFLSALPDHINAAVICLSDNAHAYAESLDQLNETLPGIERITPYTLPMNRYAIGLSDAHVIRCAFHAYRIEQPDIIIGHGAKAGFIARLVGRVTGTPAIYRMPNLTFVSRIQGRKAFVYRQLERIASRLLGGHIVVLSNGARDEVIRHRVCPADRVHVIRTGINLEEWGGVNNYR